jgi:periplasmic divalent cation tolerance protein
VRKTEFRVVLLTCASKAEAKTIARGLVEQRLAACVNITTTPVESIYRWKEKIENAREYLLVVKTVKKRLRELQRAVKSMHSYDVPEFIVLPIESGSKEYLDWLKASTKPR